MSKTVIAIPSDLHAGSVVGICPPSQWQLDAGGYYTPSEAQGLLWAQWEECWARVAQLRKRGRLIVVMNGDSVEGVHNSTTEIFTLRIDEQERMFTECLEYGLNIAKHKGKDLLFFTRGTETHVGPGASSEERIARDMGAEFESESRATHYHLRLKVQGNIIDIAHHGPSPGIRAWTYGNVLFHTIKSIYMNSIEHSLPVPRAWVRSHFHTWVSPPRYSGNHGTIEGFITPAFQLMTGYAVKYTKAAKLADVGMLILIVEDGELRWECPRVSYQPAKVVEV